MKKHDLNGIIFACIIVLYIVGQFLIGTYDPQAQKFVFSAPADVDFLYYGAITNQLLDHFPPENPAFCNEKLTQPFLQYYPAALLAKMVNPYNAIRILNVVYLIIAGFLMRRFFPENYGFPLIVLFAGSAVWPTLNSSGVDFIARGFTHVPSFILLIIALYGRRPVARILAIFLAAFTNGYLMLIFLPFLAVLALWKREKQHLLVLAGGILGLALASIYLSSAAPQFSPFSLITQSFTSIAASGLLTGKFDPLEIIKHALPFVVLGFIFFNREMVVLLIISLIFGAFIHYNPFFPIFMVYFAGSMMITSKLAPTRWKAALGKIVIAVLVAGFLISAYQKYTPFRGAYYPRYDSNLDKGVSWILKNTGRDDSFMALTADEKDLALIMQYRPVYLGYIGHLSHLGLAWKERYDALLRFYQTGIAPRGIVYALYGPIERKYFPNASPILAKFKIAYKDDALAIYRLN